MRAESREQRSEALYLCSLLSSLCIVRVIAGVISRHATRQQLIPIKSVRPSV
jgi:hypothetical protein